MKPTLKPTIGMLCLLLSMASLKAESIPADLRGDWTLDLESGKPAWMSITEEEGKPVAYIRIHIGPVGPYPITKIADGQITFLRKKNRKKNKAAITSTVEVRMVDGKLAGLITESSNEQDGVTQVPFTGKRIPAMPSTPPDLSKVQFGQPVSLFNGKDLTGWRTHETDKVNGWSAQDGMLVNTTTKTDFSPTGSYANLRTEAVFDDFKLHIEFLIEENRNSGVYLRGMYEAQVVDRDSRMQGIQGVGAIFGSIPPSVNAGKPGGEWQTYDLTLVNRHVTVVLNGVKVIDNQPVTGPTGGAVFTDPAAPGPIYLQGDHTSVKYKNIYLEPVINQQ